MASSKISAGIQISTKGRGRHWKDATRGGGWTPNVDLFTHPGGVVVKAELAGIRREDLEIMVEGSRLRIRGLRTDTTRTPESRFLLMEIDYGEFDAAVELPPGIDLTQARAIYLNGFLRVEIPRAGMPPSEPHRIDVAEE